MDVALKKIWMNLLNINDLSENSDFFLLGGHPRLAVMLVAEIKDTLNLNVTLREVSENSTFAQLVKRLNSNLSKDNKTAEPSFYSITREQQAIWTIDKLRKGCSIEYNIGFTLSIPSPVNPIFLNKAIHKLLATHAVLSSCFTNHHGKILGYLPKNTDVTLEIIRDELCNLDSLLNKLIAQPFNLEQGPVIRFYLIPSSKQVTDTIFILHHQIVHDGYKIDVIVNDLMFFYRDAVESPLIMREVNPTFREWAENQNKKNYSENSLTYWQKKLEGCLATKLELENPWQPRKNNQGQHFTVYLDKEMTKSIHKLAFQCQATMFTTLLGAFYILLERYSQQSDLMIATMIENRSDPRMRNKVGPFLNALLLRIKLDTKKSFLELMKDEVKPTVLDALTHAQVPLDMMGVERRSGSLFHIAFTYRSPIFRDEIFPHKRVYNQLTKHDLSIDISHTDFRLEFHCEYSTELYSYMLMQDFVSNYLKTLMYVANHQTEVIDTYDLKFRITTPPNLLWEKEKFQNHQTILDVYIKKSRTFYNKILIEYDHENMSSRTFWNLVKTKAHHLQEIYRKHFRRDLIPGESIGIASSRSLETLSDMIAILFAGGSFVPYDPRDPWERIDYILKDANSKLRLNHGKVHFRDEELVEHLWLTSKKSEISLQTASIKPSQLAYIIYTSGSSGKPKGVKISHKALWHYFQWFGSLEVKNICHRVDFSTNLSFDAAITTSLVALAHGKSIIVCKEDTKNSPRAFLNYLIEKKIDLCKSTPSYFKLLLKEVLNSQIRVSHSIHWLLGGEEMNANDCRMWLDLHPTHSFYNSYGPTEATVTCSKFKIDQTNIKEFKKHIPIERISRSSRFHIVDTKMRPVPHGIKGELCIEGPILADGYQNKPNETNKAFVKTREGALWYRTGDQVMSLTDGTIYYFGRQDDQVKIRGIRIELDEIRHVICSLKYVADAMVIVSKTKELPQLFAFVVPNTTENDKTLFSQKVQQHLLRNLSAAMTPQHIFVLDKMPVNVAAKVDTQVLHTMAENHAPPAAKMLVTNPLEMSLLKIWRDSLPQKKMGVDSNFFSLGGNSLLAMEVMDKINSYLNTSLPPDLIFQKPNIRQLGQTIDEQCTHTHLHHFNHSKNFPPLIMIHPATGMAHLYQKLNEGLSSFDFYGFSNDRFGNLQHAYKTIEEMASSYLKTIAKHRPHGPYILGGFCTGGGVAFEMARQLGLQGHAPLGIILIDSFKLKDMGSKKERGLYNQNQLKSAGISDDSYFGQKLMWELDHNRQLTVNYQPRSFSVDCLFFQCQNLDRDEMTPDQQIELKNNLNGWNSFLDPARTKRVDLKSSHRNLFDQSLDIMCHEINLACRSWHQSC